MSAKVSQSFYIGCSGAHPGLYRVTDSGDAQLQVNCDPGHSVYAVALSPTGRRIVFGTRNRAGDRYGRIQAFPLDEAGSLMVQSPLLRCFQPSSVTALSMPSETIALSGGLDGQIHVWNFEQPEKATATLHAHQGPVLGLCSLSPQIVASIGADDYLRLWDLDLLRCAKQVPGRGLPAHVSNLLTLTTVPEMGLLVSQRPSGDVILHSLEANFSTFPRAIDTPVSCLTVVGQFLVTGDLNAPRIRLFSLPELKELTTAACPAPPLSLIPVGTETFASIDRSGRVSLWHAGGGTLDAQTDLKLVDGRGGCGPVRSLLVRQDKERAVATRQLRLNHALEILTSGSPDAVQAELQSLVEEGLGVEALVLLADSFRKQGLPLKELRARVSLVGELPQARESAVHWYAFGDLLESLGEQARARSAFQQAIRCHPQFEDAEARLARLGDAADIVADPPEVVLDDLGTEKMIRSELEKYAALEEVWLWPIVAKRKLGSWLPDEEPPDLESLCSRLGENWECRTMRLRRTEGEISQPHWLIHTPQDSHLGNLSYSLEFVKKESQLRLLHRLVLGAGQDGGPDDAAVAMALALRWTSGEKIQDWWRTTCISVEQLVEQEVQDDF